MLCPGACTAVAGLADEERVFGGLPGFRGPCFGIPIKRAIVFRGVGPISGNAQFTAGKETPTCFESLHPKPSKVRVVVWNCYRGVSCCWSGMGSKEPRGLRAPIPYLQLLPTYK